MEKELKFTITNNDGTVLASYSTADEKEEFNNDELCKKEGLTLDTYDAVESILEQMKEDSKVFIYNY